MLVYYWKGQHATKGYSPLPPEIEEHCPVERIVQWSEPAIFFHSFPIRTFIFSGREDQFDSTKPHLLLARGELVKEIHFFEVPCEKRNLRSRASFLLVVPKEKHFLYWHGSRAAPKHRENIVKIAQPHNILKEWQKDWSEFSVHELEENSETTVFLENVMGSFSDFCHIQSTDEFSPKLFYLNSITGRFLATEIEYPLRAKNVIAPFPFLQSHLYTAIQPALFLLDNNTDIYLWEGIKDLNCNIKAFEDELKLALELLRKYVEEKAKVLTKGIKFHHVFANKEPLEFKNIFPFWTES